MSDRIPDRLIAAIESSSAPLAALLGVDVNVNEGVIDETVGAGIAIAVPLAGTATLFVADDALAASIAQHMAIADDAQTDPASSLAEVMKEVINAAGRELGVEFGDPALAATDFPDPAVVLSWAVTAADVTGRLWWLLSTEAAALLGFEKSDGAADVHGFGEEFDPSEADESIVAGAAPAVQPATAGSGLGRLASVMLDVTVELGRTRLPLRDILALGEGGVVRLGRQIDEPVDLYINGLSAAKGEIVVVNGRLGIKVTELVG